MARRAPRVSRPPWAVVSTAWISWAIGAATCRGHTSKSRLAALSLSSAEPKKPASAVTKIRKGNSEVRVDMARWLAMAQPSSSARRQ